MIQIFLAFHGTRKTTYMFIYCPDMCCVCWESHSYTHTVWLYVCNCRPLADDNVDNNDNDDDDDEENDDDNNSIINFKLLLQQL